MTQRPHLAVQGHGGRQRYDKGNASSSWPTWSKDDAAFSKSFRWDRRSRPAWKRPADRPDHGRLQCRYGSTETRMYWPITDVVALGEEAFASRLACENGCFANLIGLYMPFGRA